MLFADHVMVAVSYDYSPMAEEVLERGYGNGKKTKDKGSRTF